MRDADTIVRTWGSIPLEEPLCDLCGSADCVVLGRQDYAGYVFAIVECRDCGLVYSCPRPSPELRAALHDPRVRNTLEEVAVLPKGDRVPDDEPTVFAWASQTPRLTTYHKGLRVLREVGAGRRLLDVGCAGGQFVQMAAEAGLDAVGCDIMPEQIEHGHRVLGLDLRVTPPGRLCFGEGEFDVVTLWDVIEHVAEPRALLAEAYRVLRPAGYLLVQTPNFRLRQWLCHRGLPIDDDPARLIIHEHVYHFTPASLTRALRLCGCSDVRYWVLTDDGGRGLRPRLRRALARTLWYTTRGSANLHTPLLATARR